MAKAHLAFVDVTFAYDSAAEPVVEGLSVQFPAGWTGVIGPNGAGKTTLLRLACAELAPSRGAVVAPAGVIYCAQRTDEPPAEFAAFVEATEAEACVVRGQLAIEPDWLARWNTLSHGERKRVQIGVALWRAPSVLAVDEPTNHIDIEARRLLADALRGFRGVGLVVSHDRELLDTLCRQCLFLDPPNVDLRPGGYTKAMQLARAEHERAARTRAQARREVGRLDEEARQRESQAARSHKLRSKSGLAPRDYDSRFKRNLARYSGKDAQAGRMLRQLDGRRRQACDRLDRSRVRKQYRLGIEMRGAAARCDALFRLPAGSIALGPDRRLEHPELVMAPEDRIAIVGANGAGKSTLVRAIMDRIERPAERVVYLAQEIDLARSREVVDEVRALPDRLLGQVMTTVSCLGSRPERLLETDEPSPGEARKLLLALGMAHEPHLIVMDEPTNHLDLPSIECLERALADCTSALLLVSHDQRFLKRLTTTRWEIGPADAGEGTCVRIRRTGGEGL